MESHNIYGQIIGDLGLPGMVVTFLRIREIFNCINRIKQRAKQLGEQQQFFYYLIIGIQVSLITRLVLSMASHGLYYFYWYVMAALIVASHRLIEKEPRSENSSIKQQETLP
jgi:O-antigen ligase